MWSAGEVCCCNCGSFTHGIGMCSDDALLCVCICVGDRQVYEALCQIQST